MTSALGRLVIHLAIVLGLVFLFPYLYGQYGDGIPVEIREMIVGESGKFAPSYIQILGPYLCVVYLIEGWWRSRSAKPAAAK